MNNSVVTILKHEVGKFLERQSAQTPTRIDKLNRHVYIKQIESVFNKVPEQKATSLDRFTAEFYQTFKEANTPFLSNLFQDVQLEAVPPNSYSQASITKTKQSHYKKIQL